MPMYDYEPSLSLDLEGRASSTDGGTMGFFPDTPNSESNSREFEDKSVVVVSADGVVEVHGNLEEQDDLSPEARALLPAPNSCPRSGTNTVVVCDESNASCTQ